MPNLTRYLIYFQYIGTNYSGVVKAPSRQIGKEGIENHLERAIQKLKPVNPVSLSLSSRTDSGVHAFSNSAHFDFLRRNNNPPLKEDDLVNALNFQLRKEQIRVTQARIVPNDFHARHHAQSRTYVYRIALGVSRNSLLPLPELNLCWGIPDTELDTEAMHAAADVLLGTHDFSSFMAVSSDMYYRNPVKTLDVASMQPGVSFAHTRFHKEMPLLELVFRSRSFLYKQVRRMTGALVAVGQGKMSVSQIKDLLDARNTLAYPGQLQAPPWGLFLIKVAYRESDLQLTPQELDRIMSKD